MGMVHTHNHDNRRCLIYILKHGDDWVLQLCTWYSRMLSLGHVECPVS